MKSWTLMTIKSISAHFDPDQLPTLTKEKNVWFDEMHIEQDGGPISANNTWIRLPRNADSLYTKGVEYGPEMMKATYKYAQQGRYTWRIT